jgi:hypothetical protein
MERKRVQEAKLSSFKDKTQLKMVKKRVRKATLSSSKTKTAEEAAQGKALLL